MSNTKRKIPIAKEQAKTEIRDFFSEINMSSEKIEEMTKENVATRLFGDVKPISDTLDIIFEELEKEEIIKEETIHKNTLETSFKKD